MFAIDLLLQEVGVSIAIGIGAHREAASKVKLSDTTEPPFSCRFH
jgi:hypothetical protein